jgi:hypothetical protein
VRRGEQSILGPASPEPQPATADPSFLWKNVALSYVALSRANGAAMRTLKKPEYQIGQTIAVLGEMRVDEVTAQDVLRLVRPIAPYRRGHSVVTDWCREGWRMRLMDAYLRLRDPSHVRPLTRDNSQHRSSGPGSSCRCTPWSKSTILGGCKR